LSIFLRVEPGTLSAELLVLPFATFLSGAGIGLVEGENTAAYL
jgi:hypothetical protein